MFPKTIKNERGVAMLMAILTMVLLGILAAELVYDTEIYHREVFNGVDELRAQYLARSGLKLALLQLQGAQKAAAKAKSLGLGNNTSTMTDQIWQTPLILPAPAIPGLGPTEKETIDKFNTNLSLQGQISISITGESDKLNLNQLIWAAQTSTVLNASPTPTPVPGTVAEPSPTAAQMNAQTKEAYVAALDQLILNKKTDDEAFRNKHNTVTGDIIIQNILAWMDPNTKEDGDNHGKEEYYARLPDPYSIKNAPLSGISELHMVKGVDDDLFKMLADNFTTLITKGVNVNKAPAALFRALIPGLTQAEADRIVTRRTSAEQGGPFTSADDFWKFVATLGNFSDAQQKLAAQGIQFIIDESAYRVLVSVSSGYAQKNWVAFVGGLPPNITSAIPGQATVAAAPTPVPTPPPAGTNPATNNSNTLPNIIYLKAD